MTQYSDTIDDAPFEERSYPILAGLRLFGVLLWTLLLIGPYLLCRVIHDKAMRATALLWHQGVCTIIGIRIIVNGRIHTKGPVIYVSNHTSYTDIPVLGALLRSCFVAKQDVATWPALGTLAKIGNTIFVSRQRSRSKAESDEITSTLNANGKLILFPEGTSNDGNRVLPFKSAFLAPAQNSVNGKAVTVQPVSITYTQLNGLPMDRISRPYIAWYGDMELAPHLWSFLQLGRVTVNVDFLPPVTKDVFENRKELTRHCYRVIRDTNAHRRTKGVAYEPGFSEVTPNQDLEILNV